MAAHSLALWRDRRGELSWLRVATLAILLWPAVLVGIDWARGGLGGRPLNEIIHRTGWWALVFLLASLAITPLRRSARFAKLFDVRRMIGVACFAYAFAHILIYTADQGFNLAKVASEVVSRLYLTIGFVALLGLAALAITSNDTMVKRLGGLRWRRLHQITYGIALLSLVHFFQQTKADITVPTLYAGLFAWLIGYRLLARLRGEGALTPLALAGLAVAAGALTLLGEAIGLAIAFKVPFAILIGAMFDPELGVRPGWWVMAAGLAVALLDLLRNRPARPSPSTRLQAATAGRPGA